MTETLSVSLSGLAFSFLLYENLKSKFSQEGFLLGDIVEKQTKTITDNDQQQVRISRIIRISCAMPCPEPHFFYDSVGRIDGERIRHFLGDSCRKVVAWYKYKPSSSFSFSFREKIIHKQLANMFNVRPEFFSCCLLISECSDNKSTHSFTQTFMRNVHNSYDQIPMHIVNLSDPNNTYKSPEQVSETFLKIIKGLNINHEKTQGINIITKIQNAVQKHTDQLVESLAEAEERLFQLEEEVKDLRKKKLIENEISASNHEEKHNDIIMETDSESPLNSPTKTRRKGKSNCSPKVQRNSESPVKNMSPNGREIVTRSMKKV